MDPECKACQRCDGVFVRKKRISHRAWSQRKFCSQLCANRAQARGAEASNWRGGRYIDANGYVCIIDPSGKRRPDGKTNYVLEHRYIMEQRLGRPLKSNEEVHHKNGCKDDNLWPNLELRVGPHGSGATESHCCTCTCFADFLEVI